MYVGKVMGERETSRLRKHEYISTPMIQFVKTKLCKHFTKGYCKFEENCCFAHDISELVYRPDLTKTKLCQRFMTLGVCFNENCSFAHGIEELREIDRVPPAVWAGASLQDGFRSLATSSAEQTFGHLPPVPPGFETLWSQVPEPEYGTQQEMTHTKAVSTRRNPNKIFPQEPFKEMTDWQHEAVQSVYNEYDEYDEPDAESRPGQLEIVFLRWLLLVESILRRRRAEMLKNGRMLLDRARYGVDFQQVSRAEVESVSSILLREPAWCVEFEHLARRYSKCLRVTSTLTEPGFTEMDIA